MAGEYFLKVSYLILVCLVSFKITDFLLDNKRNIQYYFYVLVAYIVFFTTGKSSSIEVTNSENEVVKSHVIDWKQQD